MNPFSIIYNLWSSIHSAVNTISNVIPYCPLRENEQVAEPAKFSIMKFLHYMNCIKIHSHDSNYSNYDFYKLIMFKHVRDYSMCCYNLFQCGFTEMDVNILTQLAILCCLDDPFYFKLVAYHKNFEITENIVSLFEELAKNFNWNNGHYYLVRERFL
jgi:hypothetical protein